MTTKRTPGPWEVQYNTVIECWDVGKAGEERLEGLLAGVFSSEADARLIAAAPDMLDALREAVFVNLSIAYDDGIDGHVRLGCCRAYASQGHAADCWKTKARAAIAKAEGRE